MTERLTVDGRDATIEDLSHQARVNYGAYTSFGVEGGGVRGLGLHLARLDSEAEELFGHPVGSDRLRRFMRETLAGRRDAWLRVSLFSPDLGPRSPDWIGVPKVMIGVFAPVAPVASSLRLVPQTYEREMPHLKHLATFGLIRARRRAREAGYDDALFVDGEGRVSEGSLWNIGFFTGDTVIWPQAPMLDGVAQRLIQVGLDRVGLASRSEPVSLHDLERFDGAFVCNSATPACPVSAIGDKILPIDHARIEWIAAAWRAAPLEAI